MKILCSQDRSKELTKKNIEKYFSKNKQIDIKYKIFLLNVLNLKLKNLAFVMYSYLNHKNGNIEKIDFSNNADHHIIFLSNQDPKEIWLPQSFKFFLLFGVDKNISNDKFFTIFKNKIQDAVNKFKTGLEYQIKIYNTVFPVVNSDLKMLD